MNAHIRYWWEYWGWHWEMDNEISTGKHCKVTLCISITGLSEKELLEINFSFSSDTNRPKMTQFFAPLIPTDSKYAWVWKNFQKNLIEYSTIFLYSLMVVSILINKYHQQKGFHKLSFVLKKSLSKGFQILVDFSS